MLTPSFLRAPRTACTLHSRAYSAAFKARKPKPHSSASASSSAPHYPAQHPALASSESSPASQTALNPAVARGRPAPTRGRPLPPTPGSSTLAAAAARRTTPPVKDLPKREPPLVEAAREKTVKDRTLFESYLVLPPRVRLYFWLALGAFATVGLYAGDWLIPESEEEKLAHGEQAVILR
ncbi:hypothetical protein JCM21900_005142 [Sporobolomyces salmonicolor]